ncbi:hypothetical protein BRD03_00805 [Halobacteriales archaeon QS_9_68_17]|nr:MAG: hypothetical protein BRD03_00805 [Halobacteriales archaeon QS_9_68_17]
MDSRRTADERGRTGPRSVRPEYGRDPGDSGSTGTLRGQSSVLAVAFLVGLTVTGATAVYLVGSSALSESQERADLDSAENALAQVDSSAARVAAGTNNTERIRLSDATGGETRVEPDAGRINVTLENDSTGAVREVILDGSLGRIVHDVNGEEVAFQGGGVWRRSGSGSQVVSKPDIHYSNDGLDQPTVTLPLTLIEGPNTTGSDLEITDDGTEIRYPVRSDDALSNPVTTDTRINITIRSEYYRAWGDYLRGLAEATPAYDHDENEVTVALVRPSENEPVSNALLQTGPGAALEFDSNAHADSYNSSQAPYASANAENGTIVTAGDLKIQSNGAVLGDIVAGNTVEIDSANTRVTGNVSYGGADDTEIHQNADIEGWVNDNASVEGTPSIKGYVGHTFERLENDTVNDNDAETNITGESIDFGGSDTVVLHGDSDRREYYIDDDLSLSGHETLILDTTDGEISLAVDESIAMDGHANITVRGDNAARVFVDDDFDMGTQSETYVPGDRSPLLWVYGSSNTDVDFDGNVRFTGVVYAPSGEGISVDSNAEVFGGVVGRGDADIQSNARLHYDEALSGVAPVPEDEEIPRITHLHLSVNRVEITAD